MQETFKHVGFPVIEVHDADDQGQPQHHTLYRKTYEVPQR